VLSLQNDGSWQFGYFVAKVTDGDGVGCDIERNISNEIFGNGLDQILNHDKMRYE
jgi:hypothetical protein